MRKFFLGLAAAAVTIAAASLAPSSAGAAVLTPSAMQPAIGATNVVDNVRWIRVCHHHGHYNHRHCGWVWRPGHWHHHNHHHHHHHRRHHHR